MKDLGRKELEEAGKKATASAKEEAFAAGTFISFGRNGKLLREYPDGTITEIVRDGQGNRKEIDYTGN